MAAIAKLFMNGSSQAVRLPKEFRFEGDEVCIKRVGAVVILYAKGSGWDILASTAGKVDDDFMRDRNQPPAAEVRKPLDPLDDEDEA
jgi:antitoxin VapB